MSVSSTESMHKLDAILHDRPAGRNIIDYAIETIKELRTRIENLQESARKNGAFRVSWDESNANWRALKEFEDLSVKAKAWDAFVAWQKAENSLGVTENEVFPLMLAYEEAAKAAGWE